MAGPGDEVAATARGCGHLRASHADREQVISVLKAAFVQGLLDKDEFDLRVGRALASRTCAELVAVTADLPVRLPVAQPPRMPAYGQGWLTMKRAVTWSACLLIVTAIMTVIGGVVAFRIDAGAAFAVPFLGFFVATVVAGTMIGEAWDKKKRSRGQLPQRPAPDAGGQVLRGTGSAPRLNSSRLSITVSNTRPKLYEAVFPAAGCPARGHRFSGVLAGCPPRDSSIDSNVIAHLADPASCHDQESRNYSATTRVWPELTRKRSPSQTLIRSSLIRLSPRRGVRAADRHGPSAGRTP
jgi:Domain of unknown function (DUF1707)